MKDVMNHGGTETRRELIHSRITETILGAAIEVHRDEGPGWIESKASRPLLCALCALL